MPGVDQHQPGEKRVVIADAAGQRLSQSDLRNVRDSMCWSEAVRPSV